MPTPIATYVRPRQGSEVRAHIRRDVDPAERHLQADVQQAVARWIAGEGPDHGEPRRTLAAACRVFGLRNVDAAKHAAFYGREALGMPQPTRRRNGATEVQVSPSRWLTVGRGWGAEVEVETCDTATAAAALRAVGVPVEATGWAPHNPARRGHDRPSVKVTTDGSLGHRGSETVLPPVSGDAGIALLRDCMSALKAAGATVPTSTGMHVHVDANDLTTAQMIALCDLWERAQTAVLSIVPRGRRNGRWCAQNSPRDLAAVRDALRSGALRAQGGRCPVTRYLHLNLDAFRAYGTVEFRSHGGTLNGKKAAAWVALCVALVESVARGVSDQLLTASAETLCGDLADRGLLPQDAADLLVRRAAALR